MIAPTYADDWDFLKPLWEFFNMLDRISWLGPALYDPNAWNDVWPKSSTALFVERGGVIKEHIERWQEFARSGGDVEILDACYSACTLIVAYVQKNDCALALLLRCNSISLGIRKLENRL